jgi:hypothetical protein
MFLTLFGADTRRGWPAECVGEGMDKPNRQQTKRTDHAPLEPKLRVTGAANRAARRYPNPIAAQDLSKKTDSEQPHGAGGT